jgi:hypothetical protein
LDTDYFLAEETITNGSLILQGLAGKTSLELIQAARQWRLTTLNQPGYPEKGILNGSNLSLLGFKSLYLNNSVTKFDVKISKVS